ncbi:MarR family winged helix-turn-helix transcriptional regulator [Rhizosphaericola mali]|uniref:MarR family transcriptional regulator n=1 Tax=Rhizosphaericola mali TaxID=2545455 RepID=A0A5P2G792_9BACT|nr:MarR family transcriptional regulator [Rhizosphaericola mali]QES90129.1 MarR family transcriptional regulator [Rhizosphaericola mali]
MKIEDAIKQNKFDNQVEKGIVNIIYTYTWLRDAHANILKPYGILMQHFNILRILRGAHPKSMCPGEIKEVMLDKGNDVTRLIDKLVSLGLAERKLCETNRRKMDVDITKEGLDLTQKISDELAIISASIGERISTKEVIELNDLLDKIRD